jgi:hypothetical protein
MQNFHFGNMVLVKMVKTWLLSLPSPGTGRSLSPASQMVQLQLSAWMPYKDLFSPTSPFRSNKFSMGIPMPPSFRKSRKRRSLRRRNPCLSLVSHMVNASETHPSKTSCKLFFFFFFFFFNYIFLLGWPRYTRKSLWWRTRRSNIKGKVYS